MQINPEIRRNIWLEFSLHRAIAMPLVLGVVFYIAAETFSGIPPVSYLATTAGLVFFLLVKIWGGHKAADSVIDEVNDNTWDFQKLSALSPWSLTWGKLFGSTIYAWYGGLMAFAATIVAAMAAPRAQLYDVSVNAALLLLSGLVVQAAALFSSLLVIQNRTGAHNKLRGIPHLLIGLVAGSIFSSSSLLSWLFGAHFVAATTGNAGIAWYGKSYERPIFYAVVSAVMLVWLIAGIYWQMRGQMKMRTGPWLWLGFVLFLIGFMSGFDLLTVPAISSATDYHYLLAFAISFICLYVIAFQETWNVVRYRRMYTAIREMDYARAIETCPRWIPTFIICLLVALSLTILDAEPAEGAFMFAWLCFAMRDIAILHFFKLFPTSRRPFQTTKFYLAVLYVLMPFLLNAFHAHDLVALFVPWPFDGNKAYIYQGLASGLVQAVIAVLLALWRWQQYSRRAV